jgi:hypothetical protein
MIVAHCIRNNGFNGKKSLPLFWIWMAICGVLN